MISWQMMNALSSYRWRLNKREGDLKSMPIFCDIVIIRWLSHVLSTIYYWICNHSFQSIPDATTNNAQPNLLPYSVKFLIRYNTETLQLYIYDAYKYDPERYGLNNRTLYNRIQDVHNTRAHTRQILKQKESQWTVTDWFTWSHTRYKVSVSIHIRVGW